MAAVSFLQVQDVTHTYFSLKEKTAALENVSIEVEKGEFVSFLGPSGCGKTTLLSIIAGIVSPTEGRVDVCGRRDFTAYQHQSGCHRCFTGNAGIRIFL